MSSVLELIRVIEELNGDAASVSTQIEQLKDEIKEKARELECIHHIATEKLAEFEVAVSNDFDDQNEDSDEDFEVTDDDDYRSMQGLVEEISGWVDEAND